MAAGGTKLNALKKQGASLGTAKVAELGFLPSMRYGVACIGAPPKLIERARINMSMAISGEAMGKDRTLRLWLGKDGPAVNLTIRPVVKWAEV
eukprot:6030247-Pyramimonas_sp.AAC.1